MNFQLLVEEKLKRIEWAGSVYYVIDKQPNRNWSSDDIEYGSDDGSELIDFYGKVLGILHRVDGPAYVNGNHKEWWFNGTLHRTDGPAYVRSGVEAWYLHGKRHRVDGPAVVSKWGEEFWVRGKKMTKEEFEKHFEIKSEE